VRWDEFTQACPEIATRAEERFSTDELVMLGTLRADGSPRISPCEVDFTAGHLFLGMMWRSRKALDLLRDPRIVVHSIQAEREPTEGDIKLYGDATEILQPELREAYREAILARIDWAPAEPEYHLFSLDVQEAGYLSFPDRVVTTWDASSGVRHPPFPAVP
jgi:hypothetical protein